MAPATDCIVTVAQLVEEVPIDSVVYLIEESRFSKGPDTVYAIVVRGINIKDNVLRYTVEGAHGSYETNLVDFIEKRPYRGVFKDRTSAQQYYHQLRTLWGKAPQNITKQALSS